jgi:hypothetical protein
MAGRNTTAPTFVADSCRPLHFDWHWFCSGKEQNGKEQNKEAKEGEGQGQTTKGFDA